MRRILAYCLLLTIVAALPGCLSFKDRDHNREHRVTIERDLDRMHRDIDHMFKWHEPSKLIDLEQAY